MPRFASLAEYLGNFPVDAGLAQPLIGAVLGMNPRALFVIGFSSVAISFCVSLAKSGVNLRNALRSAMPPFTSVGIGYLLCVIL